MPAADLSTHDLRTYLANNADPNALWVFVHIPKTAGSSLSQELRAVIPPYRNICLTDDQYRRTDLVGTEFWDQLIPPIEAMLIQNAKKPFRSVSGHMFARHVEIIRKAVDRARLFTFLRNPIRRFVSDYNYQRSELHPSSEAFVARYPSIETYVDQCGEHNKMHEYLSIARDEPVDELISRVQEQFAFVGLVEMYPLSFNVLMRLFGENYLPTQRIRIGEPAYESVAPSVRERIAELNALDHAIYDHFHGMMMRHRSAWQELIAAEPPLPAPKP